EFNDLAKQYASTNLLDLSMGYGKGVTHGVSVEPVVFVSRLPFGASGKDWTLSSYLLTGF
ncbi:MAG: hypothetical protein V3V96_17755, partial [Acidiferrobacterales bacterium]